MSLNSPAEVYLPDVNVLLAALHPAHEFHTAAINWLEHVDKFATTAITESGFLRLSANEDITGTEVSLREAMKVLKTLRADTHWTYWADIPSLADPIIDTSVLIGPKQVTDLLLVNLAAANKGQMVTFDTKIRTALNRSDRHFVKVLVP